MWVIRGKKNFTLEKRYLNPFHIRSSFVTKIKSVIKVEIGFTATLHFYRIDKSEQDWSIWIY